jgi:hypothetical protein
VEVIQYKQCPLNNPIGKIDVELLLAGYEMTFPALF